MKKINEITQFFLGGLRRVEEQRATAGRDGLYDLAEDARKKGGVETEDAEDAIKTCIGFAVVQGLAATVADAMNCINEAGKALLAVAEVVADDEAKKAAKKAAERLASAVPMLEKVSMFALQSCDIDYLAETLYEEGKARAEAKNAAAPPATTISGTARPLSEKWQPSVN